MVWNKWSCILYLFSVKISGIRVVLALHAMPTKSDIIWIIRRAEHNRDSNLAIQYYSKAYA